ncbi:multiprotein-bridging factor 1 family protein [Mucilaginibacter sp.]|jgi:transcriptional regulator with XRE-family HTH domain|uniref:helix-turn-helix domain-containing protein n=1 Tax=Mucilaginibacter sp. TaxID=1882438 RepID=UPI003563B5EB
MSLNVLPETPPLTREQTARLVREARLKKPLTQKELADLAGISLRSLQRIENAEVLPRAYTWRQLAAHIDLMHVPATAPKPNLARKWILSVSSLVGLVLAFSAYVIQSPTFPETLFESLLMLLAGCIIYGIILYRIWD